MSFGLPAVKPIYQAPAKLGFSNEGCYEMSNPMVTGKETQKAKLGLSHPLESSEKTYRQNQQRLSMAMLRSTQGMHAPLRLAMEMKSVAKIGHLPCLPSHRHNLHLDVLTGRDTEIAFEDIFNNGEYPEIVGQPHAMMEKSMGIL